MSEPTVRLHVHVIVNSIDDDYDTEITVSQWNAMTPAERSAIRLAAWEGAASHDDGGIWTETPGATEE